MTLPNVLIVGAAKSGTTSLARNLGAHAQVFMAMGEPHFFSHNWHRGVKAYERNFEAAPPDAVVIGDKSPSYLYDADAPARIAKTLDVAGRFCCLAIVREPVSRAVSDVAHRQRLGVEHRSVADALASELRDGGGYGYLARGRYAVQLERFLHELGPDPMQIELYDDLMEDPEGLFQRVGGRLGLTPLEFPLAGRRMNQSATIRYPRVYRELLRIRAGRWLPPSVGAWVWSRLQEPVSVAPLPPDLRRRLQDHFEPENRRLAGLVRRTLPPSWGSVEAGSLP